MKLKVPTSWKDVTIKQYVDLCDLFEDKNLTEIELLIKQVSILCKEPEEKIASLTTSQIKRLLDKMKFLDTVPNSKPQTHIRIGKELFYINFDISKLSAGQYIDLSFLLKDQKEIKKNYHNIMGVFTTRIKTWFIFTKREGYKGFDTYSQLFLNNMNMELVFNCTAFFLTLWQNLMPVTANYLKETGEKMKEQVKKKLDSLNTGDGSQQ